MCMCVLYHHKHNFAFATATGAPVGPRKHAQIKPVQLLCPNSPPFQKQSPTVSESHFLPLHLSWLGQMIGHRNQRRKEKTHHSVLFRTSRVKETDGSPLPPNALNTGFDDVMKLSTLPQPLRTPRSQPKARATRHEEFFFLVY